jgi:hypothetical protein
MDEASIKTLRYDRKPELIRKNIDIREKERLLAIFKLS